MRTTKLSQFDKKVLSSINKSGFSNKQILMIIFDCTINQINYTLQKLWQAELIERPRKGLIISANYLKDNPNIARVLHQKHGMDIPDDYYK